VIRALGIAAILALSPSAASAHPAPNSTLRLDFQRNEVRAQYWLPASELAHARAADPEGTLPAYLLRRLALRTFEGRPWRVEVLALREDRYLDHDYLVAELRLSPPEGATPRRFVLIDDVITHEVRNHVVFVVGKLDIGNGLIGTLQYPVSRLEIAAR
jgi:hypothetical protein